MDGHLALWIMRLSRRCRCTLDRTTCWTGVRTFSVPILLILLTAGDADRTPAAYRNKNPLTAFWVENVFFVMSTLLDVSFRLH